MENKKVFSVIITIATIIISILTFLFGEGILKNAEDNQNPSHNEVNQSINDNHGTIIGNVENYYDNNEINEKDSSRIVMSESSYIKYLKSVVEGEVIYSLYEDFDYNGSCEMFALVNDDGKPYDFRGMVGKLYFVNENGHILVEEDSIEYWENPTHFLVDSNIFIGIGKAYTTGSLTYVWGVKDGKPYQPNISAKSQGIFINEYNEIELIQDKYNKYYDPSISNTTLYTWMPYYFYWTGVTFREYGGYLVSLKDLHRIRNFSSIMDLVKNEIVSDFQTSEFEYSDIFYRGNNIINVNIVINNFQKRETIFRYFTVRYNHDDNTCSIVQINDNTILNIGFYSKSFQPSMAEYPNDIPF